MKKIMFVHPDLSGGGAEKALKNLLDSLDYDKYDVTLLLLHKQGVYLNQIHPRVKLKYIYNPTLIKNKFLNKIYCKIGMLGFERYPKILHFLFIRKKYNIEIAYLEGDATNFINNSTNKNSQKIAFVHTDVEKSYSDERKLREKNHYSNIDNIIGVSQQTTKSFINLFPQCSDKISTIYNIIDKKEILELSEKEYFQVDRPYIISIGRLVSSKRFDLLLKAHKMLLDEGIQHDLLILGAGPLEDSLKSQIKELGITDSVKMLGFKNNPYPYIKLSELYVMTSDFEGLGLVICEALVLGKAIISTKCSGPTELLSENETGILVNCGDIDGIKDGIKQVLTDSVLKSSLEAKSLLRGERFNSHEIINQFNLLIDTFHESENLITNLKRD